MRLSPEETQLILKIRAAQEADKPIKTASLKENLYLFAWEDFTFLADYNSKFISESEKKKFISNIQEVLKDPVLKAKALFDCYLHGKEEQWFDRNGLVECQSEAWSKEYLTDIKDLRKKKK